MNKCKQCGGDLEFKSGTGYCYKCILSAEIVDVPVCKPIEANYAEKIAQLTKERDELQIKFDERGVALDFSELACERITKERDRLAAQLQNFKCFKCGDGYTPLYCLNCANDQLAAKCACLDNVLREAYHEGQLAGLKLGKETAMKTISDVFSKPAERSESV